MATLAAKTVLKENTKLPSDDQGETLPFVFLVLDCGFVVALKNTAWFAKIEIFPLSEYFYFKEAKAKGAGTELQTGIWMCERSSNLLTAHRGFWVMGRQQEENICPCFGWEPGSAALSPRDNFSFSCVQTAIWPCHLFNSVLIPALLLGQIFQGTANLLSSAAADKLSLQNSTQGRIWPRTLHWAPLALCHHPGAAPAPLWEPNALKNCCAVLLKLKFFAEFSVTNSRRECCGIGEQSQLLKDTWGYPGGSHPAGGVTFSLDSLEMVVSTPLFLVTTSRVIQREFGAETWFSHAQEEPGRMSFARAATFGEHPALPSCSCSSHEEHGTQWKHFFPPLSDFELEVPWGWEPSCPPSTVQLWTTHTMALPMKYSIWDIEDRYLHL